MSRIKQALATTAPPVPRAKRTQAPTKSPPTTAAKGRTDPFTNDRERREAVNAQASPRWIPRRKGWLR